MTDYEWLERDETLLQELEMARPQTVQMEKTMHWWSDCPVNRRRKWNKVRNKHNEMNAFIKEATELNIAADVINNNLKEIECDVEQELNAAAAAYSGNGSVENHYGKLELHVDSPVRTLPKSGARNNMDLNITKLEETLFISEFDIRRISEKLPNTAG